MDYLEYRKRLVDVHTKVISQTINTRERIDKAARALGLEREEKGITLRANANKKPFGILCL